MRSILSFSDYTAPDVLVREEKQLFRRLWILAGFRSLLDAPDAFITRLIGGVPIVVQNTTSGLKAFINQCAHRQAPVQLADFGQRRLACPYHGWVYDEHGRVKSIPGNDANYGFSADTISTLSMRPISLRVEGGFVFVNLDLEPMPFENQFHSSFLEQLGKLTGVVGDDAIFATFEGHYNWKLNFENVVDWNHTPFVHSGSFAPLLPAFKSSSIGLQQKSPIPVPDIEIDDDIRQLSFVVPTPCEFPPWPWHDSIERSGPLAEYINVNIYPNVNYTVMAGSVHVIQQFCPVAPDRTEVRLTMALGRRKRRLPAAPAILWTNLKAEKRVIDEDVAILEGLQRGMHDGSVGAFQGAYEFRLRRIAKVYRRLMEQA